jgi:hypothetical protein
MKNTLLCLMILMFSARGLAQEKVVGAVKDTTVTLSISAIDKQIVELKAELEKQIKARDEARAFLETTERNIVSITATLNTIDVLKNGLMYRSGKKNRE